MNEFEKFNFFIEKVKVVSNIALSSIKKNEYKLKLFQRELFYKRFFQHFSYLVFHHLKQEQLNQNLKQSFYIDGWIVKANDKIRIEYSKRIYIMLASFKALLLIVLKILKGSPFPPSEPLKSVCIIKFHGFEKKFIPDHLDKLFDFCQNGNIKVLNDFHALFFEINTQSSLKYKNLYFSNNALVDLFLFNNRSFLSRLTTCFVIAKNFFSLIISTLGNPEFLVILKESLLSPVAQQLIQDEVLKTYFISNSDVWNQDIYLYPDLKSSFNLDILFYSTNNKFFHFKNHSPPMNSPSWENLPITNAWVWDQDQYDWIGKILTKAKAHIVGPVVFLPTPENHLVTENIKLSILVFDVVPLSENYIKNKMPPWGYSYYNTENCKSFIKGLSKIKQVFGPSIEIKLKTKKGRSENNDNSYFEYIEKLEQEKIIQILPPETEIMNQIFSSQAVITIPFTSAAIISSQNDVPTCIYDPTNLLELNYQYNENVTFLGEEADLLRWVEKQLT